MSEGATSSTKMHCTPFGRNVPIKFGMRDHYGAMLIYLQSSSYIRRTIAVNTAVMAIKDPSSGRNSSSE